MTRCSTCLPPLAPLAAAATLLDQPAWQQTWVRLQLPGPEPGRRLPQTWLRLLLGCWTVPALGTEGRRQLPAPAVQDPPTTSSRGRAFSHLAAYFGGGSAAVAMGGNATPTPVSAANRQAFSGAASTYFGKRQRLVLLPGTPPAVRRGSDTPPQPSRGQRSARDLAFTPPPQAPASQQQQQPTSHAGTPTSSSLLRASPRSSPGRSGASSNQGRRLVLRPFNLMQSPGTGAAIDRVNDMIQASAAAAATAAAGPAASAVKAQSQCQQAADTAAAVDTEQAPPPSNMSGSP